MRHRNKILVALVILAVLIAIILIGSNKSTKQVVDTNADQNQLEFSKSNVPSNQIPGIIPTDIPVESNAKVTQNYVSTTKDGLSQSNRVYETSKSLADNYKLYTDYMKKNGWEITSTINDENSKMISGRKQNSLLLVQMTVNKDTTSKTVTISATQFANK